VNHASILSVFGKKGLIQLHTRMALGFESIVEWIIKNYLSPTQGNHREIHIYP
jgi:hypothetical protein